MGDTHASAKCPPPWTKMRPVLRTSPRPTSRAASG